MTPRSRHHGVTQRRSPALNLLRAPPAPSSPAPAACASARPSPVSAAMPGPGSHQAGVTRQCRIMFPGLHAPQFVYLFACARTSWLPPRFGDEAAVNTHMRVSGGRSSRLLWVNTKEHDRWTAL
ncbi:hypothetical protein HJG60_009188 [Phyllostomus discolor]|uniref:Uncharacterized protein n=1 Tax=Phyllostomus discolor TaxID=89673 RepID=A0A834DCX1_9CHIR|nr:hypothetical protein HJG60_009188 [Phyllostomus discolor]